MILLIKSIRTIASSMVAFIHPPHRHDIDNPTSLESSLNGPNDEYGDTSQKYYNGVNESVYNFELSTNSTNYNAQGFVDSYNNTVVSTTEGHPGSIFQQKSLAWAIYIAGFICLIGLLVILSVTSKVREQKVHTSCFELFLHIMLTSLGYLLMYREK